jgi:uncharacterized protein (DUF2147 family)
MRAMILTALMLAGPALAAEPDYLGTWRTPVNNGLIRFETCGAKICGRIVPPMARPGLTDVNNPNPALRTRKLEGLVVIELKPLGANALGEGTVYDVRRGRSFDASAKLVDHQHLAFKGCLGVFCQTQTWVRAN